MNTPNKFLKSNELSAEKAQYFQKIANKYVASLRKYNKLRRSSLGNLHFIPTTSDSSLFRDEVLQWFFSLDLVTRLIVSSIESKWASHVLHQLYIYQRCDQKLRFQCHPEKEEYPNITITSEAYYPHRNGINVNLVPDVYHFVNYFSMKSEGYMAFTNNYTSESTSNTQESFLNEIRFYKSEEFISDEANLNTYCNYFTLSEKVLNDSQLFKSYFGKLSKDAYFTTPMKVTYDNTSKSSIIELPNWINGTTDKEANCSYFSVSEIFAGFFEQVISARYILYHDSDDLNDLIPSSHLNTLLKEKAELVHFLQKRNESNAKKMKLEMNNDFSSLINSDELFEFLNCTDTSHKLYHNAEVELFVESKMYKRNSNTQSSTFRLLFDKDTLQEAKVIKEVKAFINSFKAGSEDELVDQLIFIHVHQVFTYDDIFLRRVLETLINLHSQKVADDLMNGKEEEENFTLAGETNKGKKKKKRKTSLHATTTTQSSSGTTEEKNKSPMDVVLPIKNEKTSAFSFIKKKSTTKQTIASSAVLNDFTKKEFMGCEMMIKKTTSLEKFIEIKNENEKRTLEASSTEENETNIFDIVKETVEKILQQICKDNEDKEKTEDSVTIIFTQKISSINCKDEFNSLQLDSLKEMENVSKSGNSEKNDQNDSETAYSSDNENYGSDVNGNSKKGVKKRKEKNKFFLYDTKPKKSFQEKANNIGVAGVTNNKTVKKGAENISSKHGGSGITSVTTFKGTTESKQQTILHSCPKESSVGTFFSSKNYTSEEKTGSSANPQHPVNKKETYFKSRRPIGNKFSQVANEYNSPILNSSMNNNSLINNSFGMFNFPAFPQYAGINSNSLCDIPPFYPNNYPQFNYSLNTGIPTDFMIHSNPISYDFFYLKLHKDLMDYSESVDKILSQLKQCKISCINYIEKTLKEALCGTYDLEIEIYGSFSSDLAIESSDIDLSIKILSVAPEEATGQNRELDLCRLMTTVADIFLKKKVFESINPIYTASVPVIKMIIDPEKILSDSLKEKFIRFKSSDMYKSFAFDKEELEKIKIDLTFANNLNLSSIKASIPQLQVDFIRNSMTIYPEIKPLIRLFKRILQMKSLNNSFKGGLASFTLFLLVLSYIKIHRINLTSSVVNYGKLLMEILLHYGTFCDFSCTIIDPNLDNPFALVPDVLDSIPTVLDPITYLNAGKSSYKIAEVTKLFSAVYESLNLLKFHIDKKQIKVDENVISVLLNIMK